jgi:hypothetical protein
MLLMLTLPEMVSLRTTTTWGRGWQLACTQLAVSLHGLTKQ